MLNALQASATESIYIEPRLHTDTGYPEKTPNLYLKFTFVNKKVLIIIFFKDLSIKY